MPKTIEKAGSQSDASPFTFVLSDESVDRMGDVVVQNGINLAQFRANPVALFAHQQRMPIGTWQNIRRDGSRLLADLQLATRGTTRQIDELRSLLEQRILRAASIGFSVIKSEPINTEQPYDGQRYTKTELLEASLVAVPANPNALAVRSLSPESRALFFVDEAPGMTSKALSTDAAHAAAKPAAIAAKGGNKMNIAEKVKAGNTRLEAIDKRVGELASVAESVDELSTEQAAEIETLGAERSTVEKNLANLASIEKLIAARADPVTVDGGPPAAPAGFTPRARAQEKAGVIMCRTALAHVYAHIERRPVVDVARERFAHDQRIEAICKTASSIADTTTPGWMKELVAQDVQGFVDALVPFSCYAAIASRGLVVNFGTYGSVSIPYRGGSLTDVAGAFVGENGVIPVKRATIAANTMNRYKMAVITTLTKELTRASVPQAESLLQRFMQDDTGMALDKAFLDASPQVSGVRPAGIKFGTPPITASAATSPVDKAITDLKALVSALIAANNGVRPVFIMNPAQKLTLSMLYSAGVFIFRDEVAQNRLMGAELVASANVLAGDVYLIDAAHFASGLGTPEFDTSDTATLVMANSDNTIPTQATSVADRTIFGVAEQVQPDGGLNVYDAAQHAAGKVGEGATAVSMYQQWAIALRTILPVSWGLTRPGSVAWVQAVGW